MPRPVKEWRGKTATAMPPPTVRQRIFDRASEICHICGQPITDRSWDADHVVALINGGENVESNIAPAHRKCHRQKSKRDVAEKALVAQKRMKDSGAIQSKQSIGSRGFPPPGKQRAKKIEPPARSSLYAPINP